MYCGTKIKGIHKRMRKSLLIQRSQHEIGPDIGEKSSELRGGLEARSRTKHQAITECL